jgi:ribosomal protein S18 acetylase RimI-like enzyme
MLRSPTKARVRPALVSDAEALTGVFSQSWQLAYAGMIPDDHLRRMVRRRDEAWWTQALASSEPVLAMEMNEIVVGYATFGAARSRGRYQGEIYELYVSPVYQGIGLGEHLFEACRSALDQRRLKGLLVWALIENSAACAFYWRRGGRPLVSAYETFGTTRLEKVAFTWP